MNSVKDIQSGWVASATAWELLDFRLGTQEHGADSLYLQEIRRYDAPRRVANAPDSILELLDPRGVPQRIIDMRIKFGLAEPKYDKITATGVPDIGSQVSGLVSNVIQLGASQAEPRHSHECGSLHRRWHSQERRALAQAQPAGYRQAD